MDKNGMNSTLYRKIENLQEYVRELENEGMQTIIAEKTARIAARVGKPGERVLSWSSDRSGMPVLEKDGEVSLDIKTGEPDWVVTKIDEDGRAVIDQNGKINEWIVKDSEFKKKYEPDPQRSGIFRPIGGPQKFVKLNEAIRVRQWGEEWSVDAGGYINITKAGDMYVISGRDFEDTYKVVEKYG